MSGKGKSKIPRTAHVPTPTKNVRTGGGADAVPTMRFRWSLERFDWAGPFNCADMSLENFAVTIVGNLQSYDAMTWAEIDGPTGSHFVSVTDLVKEARKRLAEIGMQDTDQLFSLRCGGKPRLWGVRDVAVLRVLWWDPEHAVCPSTKKHT